jgi:hypothetical protein
MDSPSSQFLLAMVLVSVAIYLSCVDSDHSHFDQNFDNQINGFFQMAQFSSNLHQSKKQT